ncbi:hypothetical protein, partial [Listeria monocytogenes]|uniref:hypothetical protein n=1 Tax=Listeria monocytogenes TaxID=1639 RepID=UPI002FDBB66D
ARARGIHPHDHPARHHCQPGECGATAPVRAARGHDRPPDQAPGAGAPHHADQGIREDRIPRFRGGGAQSNNGGPDRPERVRRR